MLYENDVKQELSFIYAHTVATKIGYSFERRMIDRDSIDAEIQGRGVIDPEAVRSSPQLGLQLKATSKKCHGNRIPFQLSIKNYNDLRAQTMVPRILMLLILPEDENEWIGWSRDELIIKAQAYWTCLRGREFYAGLESKTVHVIPNSSENFAFELRQSPGVERS
jgi:hypothetical protein